MSRQLRLPLNHGTISLADFSSQNGTPASPLGTVENRMENSEPVFSAILHKSWIETYPLTQHRFARIVVAGMSGPGFV